MDIVEIDASVTQYNISNDLYFICKDLGQVNHLKVCIEFIINSQE